MVETKSKFNIHRGDIRQKMGKTGEELFKQDMGPEYIISHEQGSKKDRLFGIDFILIGNFFVDVKFRKDNKIYIEYANSNGFKGWAAKGICHIAFYMEKKDEWVIIFKQDLVKLGISLKVDDEVFKTMKFNRFYRREQDLMLIISLDDLKASGKCITLEEYKEKITVIHNKCLKDPFFKAFNKEVCPCKICVQNRKDKNV